MQLCHVASAKPIAIIADDLTGAADSAAAFARPGEGVSVSLGGQPRLQGDGAAFAVTTDSRACPPDVARDRVLAAARAAIRAGAGAIYKKLDSNMRGNIGPELEAIRDAVRRPIVLTPAFPARGRTTTLGIALVDGVPVAETEMALDAEAPVAHSKISALLSAQAHGLRVGELHLAALRERGDAIERALTEWEVLVVDAESDADLDLIAERALGMQPVPVLAGSAGLAGAVARRLLGLPARPLWPEHRSGPVLAVLASSSQRLRAQVAAAQRGAAVVPLPCARLTWEDDLLPELNEAIGLAVGELRAGRDAIVMATGPLPNVPTPVALVVEHLAHLAFVVVRQAPAEGLLVGGGSTAQAVLGALGIAGIEVDDEPLSGIAAGVAVGGEIDGRPVALKPGAAGGDSALAELIDYLGRRAAARQEAL